MRRLFGILIGLLVAGGLAIQLVPYGRAHDNPPVSAEPEWDSPQTRKLFWRACADCHSNETVWPWYSNIAPVSWLVQRDVKQGRAACNVSEWGREDQKCDESAETVLDGEMPPATYRVMHPRARLDRAEREALIAGLLATFGDEREDRDSEGAGPPAVPGNETALLPRRQ
jgi:mono/diheme cytochrome c family protein